MDAISLGWPDATERGLRDGGLFELRSDPAVAVGASSLDYAGTDSVDPHLLRAELAGQHASDGVDGSLSAGVNRARRRCDAANSQNNNYRFDQYRTWVVLSLMFLEPGRRIMQSPF